MALLCGIMPGRSLVSGVFRQVACTLSAFAGRRLFPRASTRTACSDNLRGFSGWPRIGTYETSIEPYEDACTVFIPKHPTTRAKLDEIHVCEEKMDLDGLIEQTLRDTEVKIIER